MMVEADDPRKLPDPGAVLPKMNKLRLPVRLCFRLPRMKKAVNADFERTVVCNRIYLKRARNKFSGYCAANVLFDGVNSSLPRSHQAAEVVIKLQIVHEHRPEYLEIAAVISVEESGVERLYGLKERIGSSST